jgi:hypothetical protein
VTAHPWGGEACPVCGRRVRSADDHAGVDCTTPAFHRALLVRITEDTGARDWQRGAVFWHVPEFATMKRALRAAWSRGWDRAAAEFGQ